MTNTNYHQHYFVALLLTICFMSSLASSSSKSDGTLTVHVNTTTRYNGVVGDFKKEDIVFSFVAEEINKGSFSWDNVWSFKSLSSASFELSDKSGNVVYVRPHREEDLTRDIAAVLAMSANSKVGRVDSVASYIGNSVNKAFLKLKKAKSPTTVIEERIAVEIAEQVAKNITNEIMNGIENGVRGIEKSSWKAANKQYFSSEVNGFKTFSTKIAL